MNCSTCGCLRGSKEKLQCSACPACMKGYGGDCSSTKSTTESLPPAPRSSEFYSEQASGSAFQFLKTQSRLSMEHLCKKNSGDHITRNSRETLNKIEAHGSLAIEKTCDKTENDLKTLFISTTSVSLIGNSKHQDIEQSCNARDHTKAEASTSFRELGNMKEENIFLFNENPNDTNIINTSKICFGDSTESLQNFFTNEKVTSNDVEQPIALSAEALRNFDLQNAVNSREVVGKYLQRYSPMTLYPSHLYCNFNPQVEDPNLETTMRNVSVSTESEPSLKATCIDNLEQHLAAKLKPHNYLVMQALGVSSAVENVDLLVDKNNKNSSVDMRMQKILGTLKEDTKITKFFKNSNLNKIPTQIPAENVEKQQIKKKSYKKEDNSSDSIEQLVNTHRCFYNPPNPPIDPANNLHLLPWPQPVQQEPPQPQFQTLPCSAALAQELLLKQTKFFNIKPVPVYMLNIPRSPIQCPETKCQRMIFVSDFNKHLVVDHNYLPMERIIPFQCKNFFLDARLFQGDTSKCQFLYLMRGKIIDLGSSEYKDFLPILVMTSRISLNQMCGLSNQSSSVEYFLIWVTGIAPEEFPIAVSLTLWSRSGRVPSCHVVYSGQMYSIRNSQTALDVWHSGRTLLLSSQQIDALTVNGMEMLNLQLSVH